MRKRIRRGSSGGRRRRGGELLGQRKSGRDGLLGLALKEMDYTIWLRRFKMYYYSPQHSGQEEEQGDVLSWLSYTSAATIGNEIQNHSTTSAEATNISATPEHL
nr:hypothetical protein [Tanacetum cinerariifolium]